MSQSLSIGELQNLTPSAIRSLPHAVSITSGKETVALLLPLRLPPPEQVDAALEALAAVQARWTVEDQAALDLFLKERGAAV